MQYYIAALEVKLKIRAIFPPLCISKIFIFFIFCLFLNSVTETNRCLCVIFSSFYVVCFHILCFSKLSFSLLSQVFSLSSALLTAHELFGVSHRYIFFCRPLSTPKTFPQKKQLKRPRIHQPYLSLHTWLFALNFSVTYFQFSAFFLWGRRYFYKLELY